MRQAVLFSKKKGEFRLCSYVFNSLNVSIFDLTIHTKFEKFRFLLNFDSILEIARIECIPRKTLCGFFYFPFDGA